MNHLAIVRLLSGIGFGIALAYLLSAVVAGIAAEYDEAILFLVCGSVLGALGGVDADPPGGAHAGLAGQRGGEADEGPAKVLHRHRGEERALRRLAQQLAHLGGRFVGASAQAED